MTENIVPIEDVMRNRLSQLWQTGNLGPEFARLLGEGNSPTGTPKGHIIQFQTEGGQKRKTVRKTNRR